MWLLGPLVVGSGAQGLSSCRGLCGMWGLSSPTRDRTPVSCTGRWILNHWTTRDALDPVYRWGKVCPVNGGTWSCLNLKPLLFPWPPDSEQAPSKCSQALDGGLLSITWMRIELPPSWFSESCFLWLNAYQIDRNGWFHCFSFLLDCRFYEAGRSSFCWPWIPCVWCITGPQ